MFKRILRQLLPTRMRPYARRLYQSRLRARVRALPALTEDLFNKILLNDLELKNGDVVFIHSSIDHLHLDFPFYRILYLLQKVVGDQGTILIPTYPKLLSYEYLLNGETFDIRNTHSYTGILSEFARKQKNAVRSLHPTKSVCAIGRYARELTNTHQESAFPYDYCSPYYKIAEYAAKVIGLGVTTKNLSFVHCTDDALKDKFPIRPYHERLFRAKCVNYNGQAETVNTYAHNMKIMDHNIPLYIQRYIPEAIAQDLTLHGMIFFKARAKDLFDAMLDLAKKNVTIYPRQAYKRGCYHESRSNI
jgi:aminoglycoside 3-N-acetyltransferase